MRRWLAFLVLVPLFVGLVTMPAEAGRQGVDRSKFKVSPSSYPVTLTIGNSSFEGTLARVDAVADGEIEEAIREALKEMGINELDISDAETLIEKVARDEELTEEDIKNVRDNLLKIAGLDTLADIIVYVLGSSDKSAEDIASDMAVDQAREKVVDIMLGGLEDVGEGAGGVVTKVLDTVIISSDQYDKDQEKWKNRAADAVARRLLTEFYGNVKEKLDRKSGQRSRGWQLKIDSWASRNFTYYGAEGNLETCKVLIDLKKPDSGENTSASGTYRGFLDITFDYEVSPFDQGFLDWTVNKSGFGSQMAANLPGAEPKTSDKYDPSYINRKIVKEDFSLVIVAPISPGMETRVIVNTGGADDTKTVNINHEITADTVWKASGISMNHHYVLTYAASDESQLNVTAVGTGTVKANGQAQPINTRDKQSLSLDPSIWEQGDKDKWLTIKYPK